MQQHSHPRFYLAHPQAHHRWLPFSFFFFPLSPSSSLPPSPSFLRCFLPFGPLQVISPSSPSTFPTVSSFPLLSCNSSSALSILWFGFSCPPATTSVLLRSSHSLVSSFNIPHTLPLILRHTLQLVGHPVLRLLYLSLL